MNCHYHHQPCGDPFLERPQSHTRVPPASAPRPPTEPAWSSPPGCVQPERPLLPSSTGPCTPEGTSSNKAPPAWSWKRSSNSITSKGKKSTSTPQYTLSHSTFCTWCGHSSDMHCTPLPWHSCQHRSGGIYPLAFSPRQCSWVYSESKPHWLRLQWKSYQLQPIRR